MIFRFAFRSIRKRASLNIIKVAGLSLSLTGILIISLFLRYELSFDSFHKRSDRIYRLTISDQSFIEGKHFARISNAGLVPKMIDYFPEIETFVRLAPIRGGVMKNGEDYILIDQAFECDSTFLDVFDITLLNGNPENILDGPGSMIISEEFARKTFGNINPAGKILTLPGGQYYGNDISFTVKGVMKDFPKNSHFHPEFITTPVDRSVLKGWAWTYLVLRENTRPEDILGKFREFYDSHVDPEAGGKNIEAHLQKITDIHLNSNKLREIENNGNKNILFTLSISALILLLIAQANFANLSSGMAYFSENYLFISRISGSTTWKTLKLFLTEILIVLSVSLVISFFMSVLADIFIQKYMELGLFREGFILISVSALIFTLLTVLSGVIPMFQKRSVNLILFSRRKNQMFVKRKGLGKGVIVLQYVISIVLIIAVIVIMRQTKFALASGMGAGNNNLICMRDLHTDIQQKFEVFKQEMLKFNSVENVSAMLESPGGEANDMFQFSMEGFNVSESGKSGNFIGVFPCDYSFVDIFGLRILAGSNFSGTNEDNEGSGEYIINETAMKMLNYVRPADIAGKEFKLITNIEGIDIPAGRIIGVVEDFHVSSIRKEIEPLVMFKRKDIWISNFIVSFRKGMEKKAIDDMRIVWDKLFPSYPMKYEYVNSVYRSLYRSEQLQGIFLSIFTLIALFLCSMGLLGMTLLTTQRRRRETGLKKIHGASTFELMLGLNIDILKWIVISFIIAAPVGYLAMDRWLQNFVYRITLGWGIFILAGIISLITALLTISVHSWKTANSNPVETLRYE